MVEIQIVRSGLLVSGRRALDVAGDFLACCEITTVSSCLLGCDRVYNTHPSRWSTQQRHASLMSRKKEGELHSTTRHTAGVIKQDWNGVIARRRSATWLHSCTQTRCAPCIDHPYPLRGSPSEYQDSLSWSLAAKSANPRLNGNPNWRTCLSGQEPRHAELRQSCCTKQSAQAWPSVCPVFSAGKWKRG